MFVDTHAHLFYPNFNGDMELILDRAGQADVDFIIVPATDIETSVKAIELADKYEKIFAAVGVHPHETKLWEKESIEKLKELASHKKVVAIGEIGLDYFYDYSPKEKQIQAFREQIELAIEIDKPIIVHNRDSDHDMMDIIRSYCDTGLRAQFHCFNSTLQNALDLISMGHFISFTGNITFKKSESLRAILAKLDMNHLLLETDAPFLSPIPYRGKRNEPAFVRHVAEKMAEVLEVSLSDISKITSFNTFKLYGIGSAPNTIYTYQLGESLYINITNRCDSNCTFCKRKTNPIIDRYNLKMNKEEEPDAGVFISEIGDPKRFKEIVFCGFGEPTVRWNVVREVARYVKEHGGRTRLDTNGHGNFINKRNIIPEMKNIIDVVSISLNTFDPRQYSEIMQVETRLFNEMISFAKTSKAYVEKVIMTVVDIDKIDIEKARQIVEQKIGAEFRVRHLF